MRTNKYPVSTKRKSQYHLTVSYYDFYETYANKNKHSKKTFINIAKEFHSELMTELIIKKHYVFRPPHRIPAFRVQKKSSELYLTKKRLDYKKYNETGKKYYHLNLHSGSNYFRFKWDKNFLKSKKNTHDGRGLYKFTPCRKHKLFLAKHIKHLSSDPMLRDYIAFP